MNWKAQFISALRYGNTLSSYSGDEFRMFKNDSQSNCHLCNDVSISNLNLHPLIFSLMLSFLIYGFLIYTHIFRNAARVQNNTLVYKFPDDAPVNSGLSQH